MLILTITNKLIISKEKNMKINLSKLLGSDKDTALDRAWRHLEEGLRASRGVILTADIQKEKRVASRREIAAMQGDEIQPELPFK